MPTLPKQRHIARYGWIPDLPDARDLLFAPPPEHAQGLPPSIDLRSKMPPVYNQGQLGSCTANAIAGAVEFTEMGEGEGEATPSRLFIYYGERQIEGTVGQDSGAQIRDGIKVIATTGVPPETDWPYDITKFAEQPPQQAYQDAAKSKAIQYLSVAPNYLKGALAVNFPVVIGFTVYSGFESPEVAQTGVLNLPQRGEQVVGGHAVLVVGYDDASQRFTVRNSWGEGWGQAGYFTMPYAYLLNPSLSSDFWTIRQVA
jgi:C1A family cysteine protease